MRSLQLCRRGGVTPPLLWRLPLLRRLAPAWADGGIEIKRSHGAQRGGCVCAMQVVLRQHSTARPSPVSPGGGAGGANGGQAAAPRGDAAEGHGGGDSAVVTSLLPASGTLRTVRLHNMPRTWLHEEVLQFLHQVAEHAGIAPPSSAAATEADGHRHEEEDADDEDVTSAVPHVTSPFVARMHIPFGRRTGIVYGAPIIQLTSEALVCYLLNDLRFDPDDYRSRIYFTEVVGDMHHAFTTTATELTDAEESLKQEQRDALETLELDRYLMAPDLLYDMAKMRQRRLVTRRSKLLLHTFADTESPAEDAADEANEHEDDPASESKDRRLTGQKKSRQTLRCAGDYKELGRGSIHSVPLALPYVQGRRGT
ncbi:hypothetical protein TraAM80_03574 [Trypanosoma rangeli]|uniref:Uncharacterized protein n=1 Tax=Trypanosoma rangeli TaxID=5698 RepID=A0A3R7RMG7_TRYRA|nr:uncharacterized protein TraAM80_03574 [Trypanosoma rangeli]RNF07087.1 hypothetical protein TraAM80_03574 [Trypanosoma rangeli]|eukprot:RNF07087.1 hypothetical protein TraAM80_03574 [Trypanosoma rangeli]